MKRPWILNLAIVALVCLCIALVIFGHQYDRETCKALYASAKTSTDSIRVAQIGSCDIFYPRPQERIQ